MNLSAKRKVARPDRDAAHSPGLRMTLVVGLLIAATALNGCSLTRVLHRGAESNAPRSETTSKASKPAHVSKAAKAPKQRKDRKPQLAHEKKKAKHGHEDARASQPHAGPHDVREQVALQPREPFWPYRLGEVEFAADSLAEAEATLKAALERNAHYAPALSLLSKLYFVAGRHEEAVKLLEPVRAHPEAFPSGDRQLLLAGLALHEEALGRPEAAQEAMAQLGRRDLEKTGSAMVYVLLRGERPDSANDLAAAALQDGPPTAVNLNNFGITRLRASDVSAAQRAFQSAIDRDPTLPGPYYNLAILHKFYLLDEGAAAVDFRRYWSRSHDDPDSLAAGFGVLTKNANEKEN